MVANLLLAVPQAAQRLPRPSWYRAEIVAAMVPGRLRTPHFVASFLWLAMDCHVYQL